MNLRRQPYSTIEYHNATVQADTTMYYDANGNLIYDADRDISISFALCALLGFSITIVYQGQ